MAHLECKAPVLAVAEVKGSTATMLNYAQQSDKKQFIVATEAGILHEMQRTCPDKEFIPVPPEISESGLECSCNECNYMKLNTLEKVYNCLKSMSPQIEVDPEIAKEAVKPINRMLELS
jgi:quinolinate synthase